MKKYTLEVVVEEGDDEFWESINNENSSGCDAVLDLIKTILYNAEISEDVRLTKFENSINKIPAPEYSQQYFDLLGCVSFKFKDESRHETAKRYIQQHEQACLAETGGVDDRQYLI